MSKFKEWVIDILFYTVGSLLFSIGLVTFANPNNIAPGGVSGIATMLNYLFSMPLGLSVLLLNIPLIIIAWFVLGKKFIKKTAVATVIVSAMLEIGGMFLPKYSGDMLLAAIYGGLLSGAGLASFFVRGATSGGSDILVRLLQKKYPFLSTGRFVLLVDVVVVAASAMVYRNWENALYALIFIFISSKVIDEVLFGRVNGKVLSIITKHEDEISDKIMESFQRGVTVIDVSGAYKGEKKYMLYCAVRQNQVAGITKMIKEIDPNAFIIISEANEIIGDFKTTAPKKPRKSRANK